MAYDLPATQGRHTVTALFESAEEAARAEADLVAAGFAPTDIVRKSGVDFAADSDAPREQSVLKSLVDIFIFMPPHEKPTYEEALRRGGVAVAVHTRSDGYERAIDILDRDGAIDLDERHEAWQSEGWTPDRAGARPGGPGSPEQHGFENANRHDPLVSPDANRDVRERIGIGTSDMTVGTDLDPPSAASGGDAAWVRDRSHGRSRVRSYRGAEGVGPPDAERAT